MVFLRNSSASARAAREGVVLRPRRTLAFGGDDGRVRCCGRQPAAAGVNPGTETETGTGTDAGTGRDTMAVRRTR